MRLSLLSKERLPDSSALLLAKPCLVAPHPVILDVVWQLMWPNTLVKCGEYFSCYLAESPTRQSGELNQLHVQRGRC